jgi:ligand-binding SRPBCC domain-containing protein
METFVASTTFPYPLDEVFGWHERPGAMRRLTPPWEPMRIVAEAPDLTEGSRAVMELDVPGPVRPRWIARHTGYRPPHEFVDEQEHGPFRAWTHRHQFFSVPTGTRLVDEVAYDLPLSTFAAPFVEVRLYRMFAYRHRQLAGDLALHARLRGPRLAVSVTGGDQAVATAFKALLTTGGHRLVTHGDASVDLNTGIVTVGDRTARVSYPAGRLVRRRVPLLAAGDRLVNWISLDDLVGVFLFCLLTDVHGDIDAVSPNPLPRKDFIARLPAAHAPDRIATPPVGHVFRHPDLDAAVRHVLGRK